MKKPAICMMIVAAILLLTACAPSAQVVFAFRDLQVTLPAGLCAYELSFEETQLEGSGPYLLYTVQKNGQTAGAFSFLRWDQIRHFYETQNSSLSFSDYILASWQSWTADEEAAADWLGLPQVEILSCGAWEGSLPGVQITYRASGKTQRDLYLLKEDWAYVIHYGAEDAFSEELTPFLDEMLELLA